MRPHLCRPFAVYLVIKATRPRREDDAVSKIAAGTYWSTDYQVALCAVAPTMSSSAAAAHCL